MKINKLIVNCIKKIFYSLLQLKWLRTIKIQTRLIISFLLLSFIPLALTSLMSYKNSSHAIQTKIETYSVQVMTEVSRQLETELTHIESLCEELAMTEEIQKSLSNYANSDKTEKFQIEDAITLKFVEKMRISAFNASSDITSINILVDKNTIMGTGQNNYSLEQFQEIMNASKEKNYRYNYRMITDLNGIFQISIDKVVRNHINGLRIGTLILTFKEASISDICKQLDIGKNAEVFIIDKKGAILSSSNTLKIPINKEYAEKNLIEEIIKNKKKNKYGFSMDIKGEKRLVAYHDIENSDWFIVNTIPYAYLQAESKILMWNIIFIGFACLVIAIPVSFIISLSISRPLNKLKNLMKKAKDGNLDIELIDKNYDEIAEITASFNDMIASIRLLVQENIDTQNELVYTLGHVTEARSQETGNHIKRVANYSELIALKYGIPPKEVEIFKTASTLHDIGKISIPDTILLKPGKLTEEEFEVMKKHTLWGYEVLGDSNKRILKIASIIALQHHEKYDGTGYPRGLSGDEISIYSKIVALTDVFDALGTVRVYKKKWEWDEIIDYIKEQSGKQFDPKIVDLFLENLDEIKKMRDDLRD